MNDDTASSATVEGSPVTVEDDPALFELSIAVGDGRVRSTLESDLTIRDIQRSAG